MIRYLIAYGYVLLSGIGVPFSLQAGDLIGRTDLSCICEIAATHLLEEFFIISSLAFAMFLMLRGFAWPVLRIFPHLKSIFNAGSLAATGFMSASLASMHHAQVYGNTWTVIETFLNFVIPAWPAMLIIIALGIYINTRLDKTAIRAA